MEKVVCFRPTCRSASSHIRKQMGGRTMKERGYQSFLQFLHGVVFLGLVVIGPLGLTVGWAQEGAEDVIVLFREGASHPGREAAVKRSGCNLKFNYRIVNAAAAHIPHATARMILEQDPDVVAIIPDRPVRAHDRKPASTTGTTSGQVVPEGVNRIGAAPGKLPWTGAGVGVAVVDTGIDFAHQDLQAGTGCFTAFAACQDDNGHGTHVAGIIAARDNAIDVVGVAPNAVTYAVKVLDAQGNGSDSTVIAGLDWIAQNWGRVSPPIRAVNMSLGRPGTLGDDPALRLIVQALHTLGLAVAVSAGNDQNLEVSQQVPATYPEVMAIASTPALDGSNNRCRSFNGVIVKDTASWFTTDGAFDPTTGIGVTVSAPGEDRENITRSCFVQSVGILSTRLGGGTTRMSGTSMSAPHVAGVVALMWEKALGTVPPTLLDPGAARATLRSTADRPEVAPLDSPVKGYTYDGEREGILWAPNALQ